MPQPQKGRTPLATWEQRATAACWALTKNTKCNEHCLPCTSRPNIAAWVERATFVAPGARCWTPRIAIQMMIRFTHVIHMELEHAYIITDKGSNTCKGHNSCARRMKNKKYTPLMCGRSFRCHLGSPCSPRTWWRMQQPQPVDACGLVGMLKVVRCNKVRQYYIILYININIYISIVYMTHAKNRKHQVWQAYRCPDDFVADLFRHGRWRTGVSRSIVAGTCAVSHFKKK